MNRTGFRIDALECKWNPDGFDPKSLMAFRQYYPRGRNFVISPQVTRSYQRVFKGLKVTFCDEAGTLV